MKKRIAIILVSILCLSISACGGNTSDTTETNSLTETEANTFNESKNITYSVGDTVNTDKAQFMLQNFEFAHVLLANYDENYLTPTTMDNIETGNKFNVPDEGKVFISFSFTLQNIGKTKLDNFITNDHGSTNCLYGYVTIEYADGYIFGGDKETCIHKNSGDSWPLGQMKLDILAPANEYRGYIEVPMELMTNSDTPLFFVMQLPNENGEFETVV